ncbi:MAG: DUF1616 domain-containing protein [Methanocorpusculum parvum]|nr:DUF1616 domain-containing protein [Methanocorpusculum parvum]
MEDKNRIDALAEMADPKNIPKDLIVIAVWMLLAVLSIYVPFINETFIRVIFTVPVILFIPGYVLIAALFPEKKSIDGIERFALSVGLSIAVVPLIGLVLNYTPFGIRLNPIVISLVLFTLIMMIITLYRRARLSDEEKFAVPFEKVKPALKEELFPKNQGKFDKALSIILIAAIIVAAVTTVFVIAFPKDGEKFTEFYILGEDKMADDYPEKFPVNSQQFVWIGIGNHEYRDVTYTVETLLLNAEWDSATNSSVIHASMPLDRFEVSVLDNTTYLEKYYFSVPYTGYNRLEFLLYNETVPSASASAEEKIESAYRDLHLWIKVN